MKHFILVYCSLFTFLHSYSQPGFEYIINLEKLNRTIKKTPQFREVIPQKSIPDVRGIPHSLLSNYTLSRFLELTVENRKIIIPALIGIDTSNNTVFILDKNLNYDFSDDAIVRYDGVTGKYVKELIIEDSIYITQDIISEIKKNIWLNFKYVFIKPDFINVNYPDENENKFFFMIASGNIFSSVLKTAEDEFRIAVYTHHALQFTVENIRLYISKDTSRNFEHVDTSEFIVYKKGDTIKAGRSIFKFLNYDFCNNSITLKQILEGDKLFNVYPDFFVYDINALDVSGKPIQLHALKGNYVLLYFWGTWCIPCKQTTPRLLKLSNEPGRNNLKVIGIANDFDKRLVKKYLRKEKIKWISIFQYLNDAMSIAHKFRINCDWLYIMIIYL